MDENGVIVRNKVRLVAQGFKQIEGIDFDETFALVARLESIRILLVLACVWKFKLFQMDVKSAFLNAILNEEAYVEQSKGFQDPRYQAYPKESHLITLKCIIRYIDGTLELGLWYPFDTHSDVACYTDADWVGNVDDRKNTLVEYIAVGNCCSQLLWIKQMLRDYGIDQRTMVEFFDNTSVINISKNPVLHSRTKHIDIRHHFIRDLVEDKVVSLEYVPTEGQIADIFTKPLDVSRFESLRKSIGLCTIS
ncbi:Copia protein [Vitis vinifera]|uniref:Copia protein n=1 Tax=Vitis vinifera TaxID=29760 RepID=A0A438I6V1_VITVI|nr:Copia protein [Vitis vinifera]